MGVFQFLVNVLWTSEVFSYSSETWQKICELRKSSPNFKNTSNKNDIKSKHLFLQRDTPLMYTAECKQMENFRGFESLGSLIFLGYNTSNLIDLCPDPVHIRH